jgi:hypothetical protein
VGDRRPEHLPPYHDGGCSAIAPAARGRRTGLLLLLGRHPRRRELRRRTLRRESRAALGRTLEALLLGLLRWSRVLLGRGSWREALLRLLGIALLRGSRVLRLLRRLGLLGLLVLRHRLLRLAGIAHRRRRGRDVARGLLGRHSVRRRLILEVAHVDSFSFFGHQGLATLDEDPKTLDVRVEVRCVALELRLDTELIASNHTLSDHLIKNPMDDAGGRHAQSEPVLEPEVVRRQEADVVDDLALVPQLFLRLDTSQPGPVWLGESELGNIICSDSHLLSFL